MRGGVLDRSASNESVALPSSDPESVNRRVTESSYQALVQWAPRPAALALALFCGCTVYDPAKLDSRVRVHATTASGARSTALEDGSTSTDSSSGADDASVEDSAARAAVSGGAGVGGHDAATHNVSERRAGSGGAGAAGSASGSCVPSRERDCCPDDPSKREPGSCGCGVPDSDWDFDSQADCVDAAPRGWLRKLTLDGKQLAADLTDFPLLVQLTDPQLQQTADADGGDIYFTASDRTTLLDFELESYAADSGKLVAWVRIPNLYASQDAVLYLGYDDGKTRRNQAANVWKVYQNVWHLAQTPNLGTDAIQDSTGRAHGTPQGAMPASARVVAIAGDGLRFDGMNDSITFTNTLLGEVPSTLSAWVRQQDDNGDNGSAILSLGEGATNSARFLLSAAEEDRIKCGFYGNDQFAETVLPLDVWKHVAWTWNGTQSTLFVDGAIVAGPVDHTAARTSGTSGSIGGATFGYDFFMTGELDEVRIASDARSPQWLATEYANQRPDSTFIQHIGEPEAAPEH